MLKTLRWLVMLPAAVAALLLVALALTFPAVAADPELTAKPVGVDVKNAIVELQRVAPAVLIFQVKG